MKPTEQCSSETLENIQISGRSLVFDRTFEPMKLIIAIISCLVFVVVLASDHPRCWDGEKNKNTTLSKNTTIYSGQGTWFPPDLGACGKRADNSSIICALAHDDFDNFTTNVGHYSPLVLHLLYYALRIFVAF